MFGKDNNEDEGEEKKKKGFMRRFKLIAVLAVVGSIVFAGMNIQSPDTEATGIADVGEEGGKFVFLLIVEVDNPNFLGATLIKVDADVFVNDELLGPATSDEEFDIDGGGVTEIEVKLKVDNVVTGGIDSIRVVGVATVKVFNSINYDRDIDYEKTYT